MSTTALSAPLADQAWHSALEEISIKDLRARYAQKKLNVRDVVRWHLERIKRCDGAYRSFTTVFARDALTEAGRLDRKPSDALRLPLYGVPVAIKGNTNIKGKVTHNGWTGYAIPGFELRASADAVVIARLRAAGAVILGHTNLPDFAGKDTTISSYGGRTGNAYSPRHSAGGSSGGTAVAVTLNFAIAGQGTDTGNSIRNPAANASLVGIVPTHGRISTQGIHPFDWLRDTTGPMARTVEDAAIMLAVMEGRRPQVYLNALRKDALRGKRLGVPKFIIDGMPKTNRNAAYWYGGASPEVREAFARTLQVLREAGATIVTDDTLLPEAFGRDTSAIQSQRYRKQGVDAFLRRYGPPAYSSVAQFQSRSTHSYPDNFIGAAEFGHSLRSDRDAVRLFFRPRARAQQHFADTIRRFRLDALIYPPLQVAPPEEDRPLPNGYPSDGPYSRTAWTTKIGIPSIVVPAGYYSNGLPYGLEIGGTWNSEKKLLGLAYAFEQLARARIPPRPSCAPASAQSDIMRIAEQDARS